MSRIRMVPRACPVCGSEERRMVFNDVNRREGLDFRSAYWLCRRCKMIYLDPMPDWSEFRALYKEIFREFEMDKEQVSDVQQVEPFQGQPPLELRSPSRFRRLFPHPRLIPIQTSSNGKLSVLDVGCGTGSGLKPFYWSGWSVTGIDINPLALEICRKAMPKGRFIHQDFMEWTASNESFDVVRTDNCLEHIPEPKDTLAKIASLLRPDGHVYIFVPNGASILFRLFRRYHVSSWIPFHLNLFTPPAMKRLCGDVGLRIERLRTFQPHTWLKMSLQQLSMKRGFYKYSKTESFLPESAWKALAELICLSGQADELIVWAYR